MAADQQTKEKILLCRGNVAGVAKVNDQLSVAAPEDEARFYTVVKGDTLSKIAKSFYGNANAYPSIFEANKPMLSHPDKVYPGQMLRIPFRRPEPLGWYCRSSTTAVVRPQWYLRDAPGGNVGCRPFFLDTRRNR